MPPGFFSDILWLRGFLFDVKDKAEESCEQTRASYDNNFHLNPSHIALILQYMHGKENL